MDKAKKKRIKKYISWISMAAVVALLAAMPLLARQEAEADGPVASILSAEVTRGTITTALHGGGTVSAESVEEVKLPSGVKIKEFLVKNGQFVTEGTPVATVDKVSVMTAITEVTETMDYLREELESARNEKVSSAIKATAGGRVKKIFAQQGESVQEVMLRDGALAILSLDGLMAVKLEADLPLTTGESVTVTVGEEEVTGRVESNLDGQVMITIEDDGYAIGQSVTVIKDGQTLGTGELYIHNAWKATAYTGTIETVNAKEEKTLSSGTTLFTLKDRDYEGELRRRSSQHREYEQLLQELFQMYDSGHLTAPCDGEVEGVEEDSAYLLSAAVPNGWVIAPLTNSTVAEEPAYRVLLLSAETNPCTKECVLTLKEHQEQNLSPADCPALCKDCQANPNVEEAHAANCITWCKSADKAEKCNAKKHYPACIHSCTTGTSKVKCQGQKYHLPDCIESCDSADGVKKHCDATGDHKLDCIKACTKADSAKDCPAERYHDVNCIRRCDKSAKCPANKHVSSCPHYKLTYTAVVGVVVRSASGTIEYKYYAGASEVSAYRDQTGKFTISGRPELTLMNTTGFVSSSEKCNPGDIILIVTGKNSSGDVVIANQVYVYQTGALDKNALGNLENIGNMGNMGNLGGLMGGMGNMDLSSMIGGFSGFGSYGAEAPEEEPLFDLEGDTLLTVIPHNSATLVISIDEQDIAKVHTGMKATVKVEALKDQEFPAEVTAIAASGINNGGSSKFQVELTFDMSESMLPGMSAAAIVPLQEQEVTMIPAAALVQQGAKTVVYTALDEDGQPASAVEVTTGISDGTNVEILSGLTEGQKIYYRYYDTVELDTSAEAEKYTLR